MQCRERNFDDIIQDIQTEDADLLKKINELENAWSFLVFEGKTSWSHNLERLSDIYQYMSTDFIAHMQIEEDYIFPFLKEHIPRMEQSIQTLYLDHEDFRKDIGHFGKQLKALKKKGDLVGKNKIITALQDTVIYLIYLLRHHAQTEQLGVFKIMKEELTDNEKKELIRNLRIGSG